MIREAEYSESKADFIHKMAVAQKEMNETIYWLELLYATGYLSLKESDNIQKDATELIRILTTIIKNTKKNLRVKSLNTKH